MSAEVWRRLGDGPHPVAGGFFWAGGGVILVLYYPYLPFTHSVYYNPRTGNPVLN